MGGNRCLCDDDWPTPNRGWCFKLVQYPWRIRRVTSYINSLRVHLFSSFLVTQHSYKLILHHWSLHQLISHSAYFPFNFSFPSQSVCYLSPHPRPICQFNRFIIHLAQSSPTKSICHLSIMPLAWPASFFPFSKQQALCPHQTQYQPHLPYYPEH